MFEPNDTITSAALIVDNVYNISGSQIDWFRIDSGPGLMTFDMTPTSGVNLNMELYNAQGQGIAANLDANGGLGHEVINYVAFANETFYLKVYHAAYPNNPPANTNFTYTLNVDLPDKAWATKLNLGPIREVSVALYDIDNDGRDEVVVGTSKALDGAGNEIRPAGLAVLEDDGTVKWTVSFPAMTTPDPATGKVYNTTSVSTEPVFTDIDGDGQVDIIVGVGADNAHQFGAVGQPGDKGGIYAVSATGVIKWFHESFDTFGNDGRPDGVYAAPTVFDIDSDGVREVIYSSWDHYLRILDGRTGTLERSVNFHDTVAASPAVADLNRDGVFEIIAPSDITANAGAGLPASGGVLHVLSNYGAHNVAGFNQQIGTSTAADFRGKFEEQVLWSNPQIADLDGDGTLEIIHGTGNFFQDTRGSYIKVWEADGDLRYTLPTVGRTQAAPLIADLDGDGRPEIVAATLSGRVHAWNYLGQQLFATHVVPFGSSSSASLPIADSPIAVDLDNDGDLEILLSIGSQQVILNSAGQLISGGTVPARTYQSYAGSPAARDIDGDGKLEILSGGNTTSADQAVVFRWENHYDVTATDYREAKYQNHQSLNKIEDFVERFYVKILGRQSDPFGGNGWTDVLHTGINAGADVARGFIFSPEFTNRGFSNAQYVDILYRAFFDRAPDTGGYNGWLGALQAGTSRAEVLDGFIFSQEFANLCATYGIRPSQSFGTDSGAGNNVLRGTADTDVFRSGLGNDEIIDQGSTLPTSAIEKDRYGQVYRLYGATLDREPDVAGFIGWVDAINAGTITHPQAAGGFVGSPEFQNTYGTLNNTQFVTLLYQNVLDRAPDSGGLAAWVGHLNAGGTRESVVLGFSESVEYQNKTNPSLDAYMRMAEPKWVDVIEGGGGNDAMAGGRGGDVYVFRAGLGGSDTIYGFEPWDELQLSGFGFRSGSDARAQMTQQGADVVFNYSGQTITFKNMTLAEMSRVRYNVS